MRILGIDYGSKRIGLAVSDSTHTIAQSLRIINRTDLKDDIKQIMDTIKQQQVESVVIGLPVRMNGSQGEKTKEVANFIDKMKKTIKIPVIQWDERFTTVISEKMLVDADMSRKKRRKVIDKVAASVMLQSYLDCRDK